MKVEIEERERNFSAFLDERLPVLYELAKARDFDNPRDILLSLESYLQSLNDWLSIQEIVEEDKMWICTRCGYYVGELFVMKFSGCWFLCKAKSSRLYGRYVVGKFGALQNQDAILDPIEAAWEFVSQPKGRSLKDLVAEIEDSLTAL